MFYKNLLNIYLYCFYGGNNAIYAKNSEGVDDNFLILKITRHLKNFPTLLSTNFARDE